MNIESTIDIAASPGAVWPNIIDVDISTFSHPTLFRVMGVPKPLSAEVISQGLDGRRIAHFASGKRFSQKITKWVPEEKFGFTFHAEPGFRAGHVLDLANGPLVLQSGEYCLEARDRGTHLTLRTDYELNGSIGRLIHLPARQILRLFQRFLLQGIKKNSEQHA